MLDWIRTLGPVALSLAAALAVDRFADVKGLTPPLFRLDGELSPEARNARLIRRLLAGGVLAFVLWLGVFSPLSTVGQELEWDLSRIGVPDLFLLHGLFAFCVGSWYVLGFGGRARGAGSISGGWISQLGFKTQNLWREIGLGLVVGVGAWLAVLGILVGLAALIWSIAGEDALPKEPPPLIPWVAALPIGIRLLVSLSAGVVEETFFRGFLQPRTGIALSTAFFVLAHASYEQPLLLVGVTILSLAYAFLVKWRQNIWPAIAARYTGCEIR